MKYIAAAVLTSGIMWLFASFANLDFYWYQEAEAVDRGIFLLLTTSSIIISILLTAAFTEENK